MKTENLGVDAVAGIDERYPPREAAASKMINWSWDQEVGGWTNRLGYERYHPGGSAYAPWSSTNRVDGLYHWSTNNGARRYLLMEADGDLGYVKGATTWEKIDTGREIPPPSEPGFQAEPFGRSLVIANGYDRPLVWKGEDTPRALGWEAVPAAPNPWGVQADSTVGPTPSEVTIPADSTTGDTGLGSNTGGDDNRYKWKVSLVNADGSEGPISGESVAVEWTTASAGDWAGRRMVAFLDGIPAGPDGTIARRIYRTKNLEDVDSEVYYFVGQITNNADTVFYDSVADNELGSQAPDPSDSVTLPARAVYAVATHRSCLWIVGREDPYRIYKSTPGTMDTFAALDFYDVGGRDGGPITALVSYYDLLLVFRDRAIDVLRQDESGEWTARQLVPGVGTRAPHTITATPGGLLFLSRDGVHLLKGGLSGGSQVSAPLISGDLTRTFRRMTVPNMPRAVATYSQKWDEWQCYFPADGKDRPSLGVVLHLQLGTWTVREDFPVGAITTTPEGEIVFGHHTGDAAGGTNPQAGLFVVSRRRSAGETTVNQELVPADPLESTFRSQWHDFGEPNARKTVSAVTLRILSRGNNGINVTGLVDYKESGDDSATYRLQNPEYVDQGVYGEARWGQDVWENARIIEVRFSLPTKRVARFAFEVETTETMTIIGYDLSFTVDGTRNLEGRKE